MPRRCWTLKLPRPFEDSTQARRIPRLDESTSRDRLRRIHSPVEHRPLLTLERVVKPGRSRTATTRKSVANSPSSIIRRIKNRVKPRSTATTSAAVIRRLPGARALSDHRW
jgi:hypothetical protein